MYFISLMCVVGVKNEYFTFRIIKPSFIFHYLLKVSACRTISSILRIR